MRKTSAIILAFAVFSVSNAAKGTLKHKLGQLTATNLAQVEGTDDMTVNVATATAQGVEAKYSNDNKKGAPV